LRWALGYLPRVLLGCRLPRRLLRRRVLRWEPRLLPVVVVALEYALGTSGPSLAQPVAGATGSGTRYPAIMDPESIRAFAQRARGEVEREKRAYWAKQHGERTHRATLDVSRALYEHVRRVRPDFPTDRDRAEDLSHHVALKRLLDLASRALAVR
jgi:hypothetical protein